MIAIPVGYITALRAPSPSTPLAFAQVIVAVCAAVAAAPFVSDWRVGHVGWLGSGGKRFRSVVFGYAFGVCCQCALEPVLAEVLLGKVW